MNQVQFRGVHDKLEDLDDEEFDDDEETEWQHYLRASIECIMRVADVFPTDVLRIIDTNWKETMAMFMQVEACIKESLHKPCGPQKMSLVRFWSVFGPFLVCF